MKIFSFALFYLALLLAAPPPAAASKTPPKHTSTLGTPKTVVPARLKPGEYVWHPELSPQGPIVVVVSLPEQRAYVYRNGVLIGASTVSTGKKGHETPRFCYRCARSAAADGKPLKKSGGQIGSAQADHFLIGVDISARFSRVGARKHTSVGK